MLHFPDSKSAKVSQSVVALEGQGLADALGAKKASKRFELKRHQCLLKMKTPTDRDVLSYEAYRRLVSAGSSPF